MADTHKGQARLEGAYRLATPADNIDYYRDFAETYDTEFAEGLGYSYPARVAELFQDRAESTDTPVADIGCGTGLVAVALQNLVVDGMDISPEMLAKANARDCYRQLYEVDLTDDKWRLPTGYRGVISAGTFTHGHLGPETLERLLDIAAQGALFVIGINAGHFDTHGFAACVEGLQDRGKITVPEKHDVPIYDKDGHDHAEDRAVVLVFRKTS